MCLDTGLPGIALRLIVFQGKSTFSANLEELGLSGHFEWDDLREAIVVQPEMGLSS